MNNLQNSYNAFYDFIIEAVNDIEKNLIDIEVFEENIDEILPGIFNCTVKEPVEYESKITNFGNTFFSRLIFWRANTPLKDKINGDSITLHDKLYGDFIDEKYKLKFLEIAKNGDTQKLSIIVKDAVRSIIKMGH